MVSAGVGDSVTHMARGWLVMWVSSQCGKHGQNAGEIITTDLLVFGGSWVGGRGGRWHSCAFDAGPAPAASFAPPHHHRNQKGAQKKRGKI